MTSCCASNDILLRDFHIASVSGDISRVSRNATALFTDTCFSLQLLSKVQIVALYFVTTKTKVGTASITC